MLLLSVCCTFGRVVEPPDMQSSWFVQAEMSTKVCSIGVASTHLATFLCLRTV